MSAHRNSSRTGRPRILVADDEPQIRELFAEILAPADDRAPLPDDPLARELFGGQDASREEPDYELTLCAQGEEAVAAVRQAAQEKRPFAVAFLDVRMPPGRGGVAAAEEIRRLDPYVQIIFVTAFTDIEPRDIARRIPPADRLLYLQKPFHTQEIRQFAASLAAKWRAERNYLSLQTRLEALVGERTMELAAINEMLKKEIEERERVAELIATAKREWESTFDSVQDPIVILDGAHNVIRLNMATAHRLGLSPQGIAGRPCSYVFDSPDAPGERSEVIKSMADRGFHSKEMSIPRLRGEFIITASPIYQQNDEPLGTVFVAHDVTERKVLERRLRQGQKMEAIGTLAGGIAHDFNNILGIIMGFSEMILDGSKPDSDVRRRVNHILEACRRAKDLVQQILTFSRQSEHELKPLKAAPLVKETMKLIRATLPNNIVIEEVLQTQRDRILAEPTHIQQIVMNLCANAAHAMRDKGGILRIELCAQTLSEPDSAADLPPGDYLRLAVSDTGHGVPKDIADRIFDPFFTTKKPGEGTGMGLSVVHGIVRDYKGRITAGGQEGQGAVFEVLLPLAEESGDEEAAPSQSAPSGEGRILLVDDEAVLAEIEAELLRSLGFSVAPETDPRRALDIFRADPGGFTLVITDQSMPKLSGAELAREILAIRPDMPVIMCTGFSETLTRERAMEMGVKELLYKPVLKKELAETIRRVISLP